jgi:hypothetical protein
VGEIEAVTQLAAMTFVNRVLPVTLTVRRQMPALYQSHFHALPHDLLGFERGLITENRRTEQNSSHMTCSS